MRPRRGAEAVQAPGRSHRPDRGPHFCRLLSVFFVVAGLRRGLLRNGSLSSDRSRGAMRDSYAPPAAQPCRLAGSDPPYIRNVITTPLPRISTRSRRRLRERRAIFASLIRSRCECPLRERLGYGLLFRARREHLIGPGMNQKNGMDLHSNEAPAEKISSRFSGPASSRRRFRHAALVATCAEHCRP